MNENIEKLIIKSTEMYLLNLLYKNKLIVKGEYEELKKYL